MIDTGLKNRVALGTGANSGIGEATARALAAEGARLVVHFLESAAELPDPSHRAEHVVAGRDAAERVVSDIRQAGGSAIAVEGDLSDASVIVRLFDAAEAAFGPVEVLVNNAAHCETPDDVFSVTAGSIDRHFAVNARAAVLLMGEMARRLRARGAAWGRVINISTDAAQAFPTQIAYGASKAALEAFTRSIAYEVGPLGITVNTVAPGPVQTGYITPELEEQLLPVIPLRRVGRPDDIADAVVFLASEQARWVTGQVLKVSGGHAI